MHYTFKVVMNQGITQHICASMFENEQKLWYKNKI